MAGSLRNKEEWFHQKLLGVLKYKCYILEIPLNECNEKLREVDPTLPWK